MDNLIPTPQPLLPTLPKSHKIQQINRRYEASFALRVDVEIDSDAVFGEGVGEGGYVVCWRGGGVSCV